MPDEMIAQGVAQAATRSPMGRTGFADAVAKAALFFALDDACYVGFGGRHDDTGGHGVARARTVRVSIAQQLLGRFSRDCLQDTLKKGAFAFCLADQIA